MKEYPSQFAVIGLGRFGKAVAKELAKLGMEVLALDIDEENVREVAPYVTHSAVLDATDENALREMGMKNFDAVIISIAQDMQASVLATLICKELGAKMVIAKASDSNHRKVLEKIGADRVVFPESDQGEKIAHQLAHPSVVELTGIAPGIKFVKIEIPEHWDGKPLADLNLRQKYGTTIVMVERNGDVISSPDGTFVFKEKDEIVVFGDIGDLDKFVKKV